MGKGSGKGAEVAAWFVLSPESNSDMGRAGEGFSLPSALRMAGPPSRVR